MKSFAFVTVGAALILSACSTSVQSNPSRTATEEMLISTAAERAAEKLDLSIPANSTIYIDNSNFEGTDSKYAVAAIKTRLLQQGMRLVDDKKTADIIIETRSGALSTDQNTFLVGVPQFSLPIPFASTPLTFPEIALYGEKTQKGVAKFAITGYDAKKRNLVAAQEPQYGFSHNTQKTVLIFISWTDTDAMPDESDLIDNKEDKGVASSASPKLELPSR